MLEAFVLCGSLRDAGEMAGVSHHSVARYVAMRDEGRLRGMGPARRGRIIDARLAKIEEWVERSHAKIRADGAFDKLKALGFAGSGRTAVAEVKANYRCGRRRVYRRWDRRGGDVGAVGLGRGPGRRREEDESVLWGAGVVEVPGGAVGGSQVGDGDFLCGPGDARLRRRCDVLVDRQRAHRHDRSRRCGGGAPSGDGRDQRLCAGPRWRRVCRRTPIPKAARRRRCGSPKPTWRQPRRTRATATPAAPSWSAPARRGWPRSTVVSIG